MATRTPAQTIGDNFRATLVLFDDRILTEQVFLDNPEAQRPTAAAPYIRRSGVLSWGPSPYGANVDDMNFTAMNLSTIQTQVVRFGGCFICYEVNLRANPTLGANKYVGLVQYRFDQLASLSLTEQGFRFSESAYGGNNFVTGFTSYQSSGFTGYWQVAGATNTVPVPASILLLLSGFIGMLYSLKNRI
jgi:hypothetical protein